MCIAASRGDGAWGHPAASTVGKKELSTVTFSQWDVNSWHRGVMLTHYYALAK